MVAEPVGLPVSASPRACPTGRRCAEGSARCVFVRRLPIGLHAGHTPVDGRVRVPGPVRRAHGGAGSRDRARGPGDRGSRRSGRWAPPLECERRTYRQDDERDERCRSREDAGARALRRRARAVEAFGRLGPRVDIVVLRLDDRRMPGPAILGGPTDRRTEFLIHQAWVDPFGPRRELNAVGPQDDQLRRGSLLASDQRGGRADVGVEDDHVRLHVREEARQIHVVRRATDDLEPLALDQVMEWARRVDLGQHNANQERWFSDIEVQWLAPSDRLVVHDGHPRTGPLQVILRRRKGPVKGLDGLGWPGYVGGSAFGRR